MPDSTQKEKENSLQSPDLEKYKLSEEQRKNLTSGVSIAEDDPSADLADLEEKLAQTRDATDEKKAWITAIIPPWIESNEEDELAVQFLVTPKYSFWKTYEYPEDYLPENHPFRRLINSTGYNMDTLEKALGEQVPLRWNSRQDEWEPDIETEDQELRREVIMSDGLGTTTGASIPRRFPIGLGMSVLLVILYIASNPIISSSPLISKVPFLSMIFPVLVVASITVIWIFVFFPLMDNPDEHQ